MLKTLQALPLPFWAVIALLGCGLVLAARNVRQSLGIPIVTLLATIVFWYLGDAFYNDYTNNHMQLFTPEVLDSAWWQVAGFLAAFLLLTPVLHRWLNRQLLGHSSQALHLFKVGIGDPQLQRSLTLLCKYVAVVWVLLLAFATVRYKNNYYYYLFPYLGEHPGPWVVSGVASGILDSLLALANNLQLMVGSLFGVIAALSTNPRIRSLALLGVFLTWPFFVFSFVRNCILLTIIPGLLAWILLRLRIGMFTRVMVFVGLFLAVNAWFGFIIAHRSGSSITNALKQEGFNYASDSKQEHEGLNMFEELCWINTFQKSRVFEVQWGKNYLANLANPIPRSLWQGKPTIGLDYADARGGGGGDDAMGVTVTLSNGMIGQGVVNFGHYVGPAFAALLASLWVCWVARFDLLGRRVGYLPLFGLGLILTFNMGRDIGPFALYPFLFGFGICWWLNRQNPHRLQNSAVRHQPRRKSKRNHGRGVSSNPPPHAVSHESSRWSGFKQP